MKRLLLGALLLALPALPAAAHHPGDRIDAVMTSREPAFEPTDISRAPWLRLSRADGSALQPAEFDAFVVVLSFVAEECGAPCTAQQALLRAVQEGVNITPMRERVRFVTVGPASGTGWDAANWQPVTADGGAAEAAAAFAALSNRGGNAPMIHVIGRGGRHAAIFHGADFDYVNLILYINELTNAPPPGRGWLDGILGVFR